MPHFSRNILFSLALLFTASPAIAIPESNFAKLRDIIGNLQSSGYSFGSFTGVDNKKISYMKTGAEPGARGCVVLSPGQSEAAVKYIELAFDLQQQGFSPIYTIDHRGQGFSDRLLADSQKNHVAKFSDYSDDLKNLVNNIVLNDSSCRGREMFLLSHSMGGAIAAAYLEDAGAKTPFKKAVLNSPMLKILFPDGKNEDGVIRETWLACHTPFGPKCDDFVPGKGPYDPNPPFAGNSTTHSPERFAIKLEIYAKWPKAQVGGPTVQWVSEAANADKKMRSRENVAKIAVPVLILQAGEDSIVDNAGQNEFCPLANDCRIEKIEGAKHEILGESDSIRDPAIAKIVDFFSR